MKVVSEWEIGEGLFSDDAVDVEIEFPNCTAVFQMRPLTADVIADLEAGGVSFDKIKSGKQALIASRTLFGEIVVGWSGLLDINGNEVPFTEGNRDKLAAAPALVAQFWQIAADLAAKRSEAEAKN
jgi:hypothetical protein